MPILLILLLIAVLAYMWLSRRNSSLTRACRWREDRRAGPGVWRCAACGATCTLAPRQQPRACLRKDN